MVGLLGWSLPSLWREQIVLKGYIPTQHDCKRLIAECEAIECHVQEEQNEKESSSKKKKKKVTNDRKSDYGDKVNKYYCTEHGQNSTHSTADCFTLKNHEKKTNKNGKTTKNRTFSNKAFRKEINMLAHKSSKKKVLDL